MSSCACTSGAFSAPALRASWASTSRLISSSRTAPRICSVSGAPRCACCCIRKSARACGTATPLTVAIGSPAAGFAAGLAAFSGASLFGRLPFSRICCAIARAGTRRAATARIRMFTLFLSFLRDCARVMASAWMGFCISSPSAWYTMRWRATVGCAGEARRHDRQPPVRARRRAVSRRGRRAARSRRPGRGRVGSSAARRSRILAATLILSLPCTSPAPAAWATTNSSISPMPPNSLKLTQLSVE